MTQRIDRKTFLCRQFTFPQIDSRNSKIILPATNRVTIVAHKTSRGKIFEELAKEK